MFLCLGGIATIGVRHAGDTPSWGFYGSKTPRCAAGLCGGLSVLCSTCSPPRPHAPKKGCLGQSGLRSGRGLLVVGVIAVFGAWGGRQLARRCRVWSCCLGGIATIGVRHAGDTPSRGFYGCKTPRCAAGLCGGLSVLCLTCSPPRPHAPKSGVWGEVDDVVSVGSRCWACAIGPRRRGRRRRCEGWLPASSCPVAAFVLVVWGELRP